MKRTHLAAACFKLIHSHLLLHTCKIKPQLISDLMMPFGLQWGVVPILSSFCEFNLPVTLWTLLSCLSLPFPPFSIHFFFYLSSSSTTHLYSFPSLHGNSFVLIYYTLFLLPLPPAPSPHQDHDKTQEEVLKHQASISQLKRSFMEAPPPSPPQLNQWEKRLTSSPATIRVQQQQVVCLPDVSVSSL